MLRYIVVNGRNDAREANYCTICCTPLGKSYVREIGTSLLYHSHYCLETHVRQSTVALESPRKERREAQV